MTIVSTTFKGIKRRESIITLFLYPSYSLHFENLKWMQMSTLLQANLRLLPWVAHLIAKDLANSVRIVNVCSSYYVDIQCCIPAFWRAVVKFFIFRFFAFKTNLNYIKARLIFQVNLWKACVVNLPCPWVIIQHLACHEQFSLPRASTDRKSPLALLS